MTMILPACPLSTLRLSSKSRSHATDGISPAFCETLGNINTTIHRQVIMTKKMKTMKMMKRMRRWLTQGWRLCLVYFQVYNEMIHWVRATAAQHNVQQEQSLQPQWWIHHNNKKHALHLGNRLPVTQHLHMKSLHKRSTSQTALRLYDMSMSISGYLFDTETLPECR